MLYSELSEEQAQLVDKGVDLYKKCDDVYKRIVTGKHAATLVDDQSMKDYFAARVDCLDVIISDLDYEVNVNSKVEYKKMESSQDMVLVPRSLLNEAAVALENKAWADETIVSLRSFASSEKQKSIIHIVAGAEDWEPTLEDLESLCDLFMGGLEDEEGAVLVTRKGVRAQIEYAEEADIHNSSVRLVRASVNPDIKYHALNPVIPEVSFDDSDVAKELVSNCATVISKLGSRSTPDLHRKAFELEKNFGVIRAAMILLCKRKIMCKERIHHLAELKLNEWN